MADAILGRNAASYEAATRPCTTRGRAERVAVRQRAIFAYQFDRMGMDYEPDDLERHRLIWRSGKYGRGTDGRDLDRAEDWLARLAAANTASGVYDPTAFEQVLGRGWLRLCRSAANQHLPQAFMRGLRLAHGAFGGGQSGQPVCPTNTPAACRSSTPVGYASMRRSQSPPDAAASRGKQSAATKTPEVRILMYHQVGPFARPRQQRGLYCHVASFRRQMAYLQKSRLSVISLRQAREGLFGGGSLPPASVVLMFDDGFQNFADHAWPVLQAHRFPATVFAVADRLGQSAEWMSDVSSGDRALMDSPTLRALATEGLDVGSHTMTHQRLGQLNRHQQRREIVDSKTRLEDTLGCEVPHFCYPYGHYDAAVRDQVAEAGYRCGLTCTRDRADRATNAFEIPRQGISFKDTVLHYAWKLRVAYR